MNKFVHFWIFIFGLVIKPLHADTASMSMNITATVTDSCAVATIDSNFGPISGYFIAPLNASNGQIIVACTFNLDYNVAIGATPNANSGG